MPPTGPPSEAYHHAAKQDLLPRPGTMFTRLIQRTMMPKQVPSSRPSTTPCPSLPLHIPPHTSTITRDTQLPAGAMTGSPAGPPPASPPLGYRYMRPKGLMPCFSCSNRHHPPPGHVPPPHASIAVYLVYIPPRNNSCQHGSTPHQWPIP